MIDRPLIVGDLTAPNIFRLSRRGDAALVLIQPTIMKLCIHIRCPASSCTCATHYFRQIRAFAYRLRIQRQDGPAGCR